MGRAPADPQGSSSRTILVAVQLFANLADYLPGGTGAQATPVAVSDGATVTDLARRLGIPDELPRLVLVNGRDAERDRPLRSGDIVSVLPPLVGG